MKLFGFKAVNQCSKVAPFAGAWIEIEILRGAYNIGVVAPFAGAWIEIQDNSYNMCRVVQSLPSRERGLKYTHLLH